MEIKKALCDSIIVPTLVCASEIWTCNEGQRIQAVEMSYVGDVCGLNRMDGESIESMYGKLGMSFKSEGMNC